MADAPTDTAVAEVDAPDTTTDAAPELDASAPTDDSATESESPAQPASDDGQPRDPVTGQFTSATAEAPAEDTPAPPAATESTSAPAVVETPEPPPQPFAFRVRGDTVPLEGATYAPGKGLTIPEAQIPTVQRLLARGTEYERFTRREIQESKQAVELAKAESDALMQEMAQALSSPEAVIEWAENFEQNRAVLLERAKRRSLEAELATLKRGQAAEAAPKQAEDQTAALSANLAETVKELAVDPTYGPVLKDAEVVQWLNGHVGYLYREATADDSIYGVQPGEIVLDTDRLAALLDPHVKKHQAVAAAEAKAAAQAKAAQAAAAENAKRQAATVKPPPPAVRTAKAAPVPAENKAQDYNEWKNHFLTSPLE